MATTDFTYDSTNRLSGIAHKQGSTNLNTYASGQSFDDVVARGGYLQKAYSAGARGLLSLEGMAVALKNSALANGNPNVSGPTFGQWLNSGLTPDFRLVFGEFGPSVAAAIAATLGSRLEDFLLDD